jgi:CubicO group peptidase (beta-lactamase class C family)
MTRNRFIPMICLPLLVLLLFFIIPTNGAQTPSSKAPSYWPTTEWQTSTPEAQDMDSTLLSAMDEYIDNVDWGIAMVASLVIKNGYIVHETYYSTYDETDRRNIFSCTKSFVSTLVGIAFSEGYISSLDEPVMDFFTSRTIANMDSRKEAMTIENLLTMTAGFDWPEHPYGADSPYNQMTSSTDWVQFVLDRPMAHDPGEVWNYNSGASHLLSTIVNITTGQYTHKYAEDRLFTPLGILQYDWGKDPDHNAFGGASLRLTPRDMAKLGFLFLNNGTWDGVQIVPADWVATATSSHEILDSETGYGYQWWTSPIIGAYSARGYLGQLIYVFPDLDMVVIFTASTNYLQDGVLIEDFILPAAGVIIGGGLLPYGELITAAIISTLVIILPITAISAYLLHRRRQIPSS